MTTAAQHLTVGGLLNFDFLLASVPTTIQIISVSATLFAHYTLRSIQRPSQPPQYASKRTRLFLFDAKNPPCTDTKMLALNSQGSVTPTLTGGALPLSPPISPPSPVLAEDYVNAGSTSGSGHCGTSPPISTAASSSSASCAPKDTGKSGKTPTNGKRASSSSSSNTPLQIIEAGGSYHVSHLARLPNDDIIRPSTLEGTKTPISTKHELTLEIRFVQVGDDGVPGKPLVLKSEQPITLSSVSIFFSPGFSPFV